MKKQCLTGKRTKVRKDESMKGRKDAMTVTENNQSLSLRLSPAVIARRHDEAIQNKLSESECSKFKNEQNGVIARKDERMKGRKGVGAKGRKDNNADLFIRNDEHNNPSLRGGTT
jgi:hypothetical protein